MFSSSFFAPVFQSLFCPFLPLSARIGGRTATKIPRPKDIFSGTFFIVILQNFWPPGNRRFFSSSQECKLIDVAHAQGIEFAGCGCAASEFGCCPDGNATATGDNFQV